MRLIDADALLDKIERLETWIVNDYGYCLQDRITVERKQVEGLIEEVPTVEDVAQVVRCKDCVLHNNCSTEDAFNFAKVENPFCCVGKNKG